MKLTTHLIRLKHLSQQEQEVLFNLRKETARAWNDIVEIHKRSRENGKWLSKYELDKEIAFKRSGKKYSLHSNSVLMLTQKFDSACKTAKDQNQPLPYKTKEFVSTPWITTGINISDNRILLSLGRINKKNQKPLEFILPLFLQQKKIVKVELCFDVDYYLAITIEESFIKEEKLQEKVAGIDLGEIHLASITTEEGQSLLVNGRYLRSIKRLRNKRLSNYQKRLENKQENSKRSKKLQKQKAKASSKFRRQERDLLHKASRRVIEFCQNNQITEISIGDVRNLEAGGKGKRVNQKISQWARGKFRNYLEDKAIYSSIASSLINESWSSKTCSCCGSKNTVVNRNYICSDCGVKIHRDSNGSANICSKAKFGCYSKVSVKNQMYLRKLDKSLLCRVQAEDQSCTQAIV